MLKPAHVADDVAGHGAGLDQVLLERRKERLQPAQPAREQPVPVIALRHAAAIVDRRRQGVTVEDRDTIEVRAEHARGQQAADARADDDGVVAVEASGRGPWGENCVHVTCSFAVLLNAEGARLGRRGQAVMSEALLNWEEKVRIRFRVQGSGFGVQGSWVQGSGFTVQLKNGLRSIQNPSGQMRTASSRDTAARLVATSPQHSPGLFAEKVTSLDLIRRARSPQIRAALLVALGYYVGARIGFALTLDPSSVPILWPPTAILLAGLLLTPVRSWAVVVCRHLRGVTSPRSSKAACHWR